MIAVLAAPSIAAHRFDLAERQDLCLIDPATSHCRLGRELATSAVGREPLAAAPFLEEDADSGSKDGSV